MPAWNEILNETKAAGSVHDVVRRRYLKKLTAHSKRNTIIYYSGWLQKPHLSSQPGIVLGISDADKNGFMSVIHKLDRSKGLDLILHTPGGDMAATESLVDYLRAMFDNDIRAIIPQLAMSGGTIIALACKQIIMGKESSIGPIDPQFGPMAATGLLQEFERIRGEIKKDHANALLWEPILRKIQPGFITECENAIKWSQTMTKRFLETCMFAGEDAAAEKIAKIISELTEKTKNFTHGRHIGLAEATQIFGDDKVIPLESDNTLQDMVLTVHHASIVTLQATQCYKMIENQTGRAFMQAAQQLQVLQQG
jgi:ATP-dependent protease ClpP protease subunit